MIPLPGPIHHHQEHDTANVPLGFFARGIRGLRGHSTPDILKTSMCTPCERTCGVHVDINESRVGGRGSTCHHTCPDLTNNIGIVGCNNCNMGCPSSADCYRGGRYPSHIHTILVKVCVKISEDDTENLAKVIFISMM